MTIVDLAERSSTTSAGTPVSGHLDHKQGVPHHGLAGWPVGYHGMNLVRLAARAVWRRNDDVQGWPSFASLVDYYQKFSPTGVVASIDFDDGVIFGDVNVLRNVDTDASISLCRIGVEDQRSVDHEGSSH